jgi:hypothetical protein
MNKIYVYFMLMLSLYSPIVEAKRKEVHGLLGVLFPIPVAMYNAASYKEWLFGQDDYVARSQGYGTQDGFFEIVKPSANSITFKDVAGLDAAKEDVQDIIEYLKNPESFKKLGAKIPKGLLLHGAPGTGKTVQILAQNGPESGPKKCRLYLKSRKKMLLALSLLMKSMRWLQKDRRMMTEYHVMT